METVVEYDDRKTLRISTDDRRMITKLLKLSKQNPSEMEIIAHPEENDGCLYVKCPIEYLKISPKRRLNLTHEERIARGERLKAHLKTKSE